ncbi:MAG: PT domain-containing protein [Clostridia bacterium]|nr:PT domain-containing protein [Clostridia bacterium]
MKKVLALIIAAMMIVSMIPVMAITTSAADVEGDFMTYRFAGGYDEPEEDEEPSYIPASGYEYTADGFQTIPPSFKNTNPNLCIQTKDKVSLKDGVYMDLRIDEYAYRGTDGTADAWIAFSIWDSQTLSPGSLNYGQGWLCLLRRPQGVADTQPGHAATVESYISSDKAFAHQGGVFTPVTPTVDDAGFEHNTLQVTYDGTNYHILVDGAEVAGSEAITAHFNNLDPNGEFYIGVSIQSGVFESNIKTTITKWGTDPESAETPTGSDSEVPEENILWVADMMDSSTVEEGQPALLFDAEGKYYSGKLGTMNLDLEPQGDNSFKVNASSHVGYFTWGIKRDYSYEAADFPVIAMLVKDEHALFDTGVLRYSAGKYQSADDTHMLTYTYWDEDCLYFGEDEEYTLIVIDLKTLLDEAAFADGWSGRINSFRFDFNALDVDETNVDPETDYFNLHWAGVFRSVEDAQNYGTTYMKEKLNLEQSTESPTEEPTDAPTEEPTDAPTEEATKAPEAGTKTEDKTDAPDTQESGCASVVGSVAVLMAAAAAAVVLKKRD